MILITIIMHFTFYNKSQKMLLTSRGRFFVSYVVCNIDYLARANLLKSQKVNIEQNSMTLSRI